MILAVFMVMVDVESDSSMTRGEMVVYDGQSIQQAVDNATPGDTIRVYAGTYTEHVIVNKTLTLMGNGTGQTTLHGSISVKAAWCNISGFEIFGSGSSVGIGIRESNVWISDCRCSGHYNGIVVYNGTGSMITNCIINSSQAHGLSLWSSSRNTTVDGCLIEDNAWSGLGLHGNSNIISNCTFRGGMSGISLWGDYNIISHNEMIENAQFGISMPAGYNNNSIVLNWFIGNNKGKVQAKDDGTDNTWNNNFWSDLQDPDVEEPFGVVDVPYPINGSAGSQDLTPRCPFLQHPERNISINEDVYFYGKCSLENVYGDYHWELSTNVSWLECHSNASFNGTPVNEDVGSYWLNVTAVTEFTNRSVNLTITVLNMNDPPEITSGNILSCLEDQLYSVQYTGSDVDLGDALEWDLNTNASFLALNGSRLHGIPDNWDVGWYWVNITINDGEASDHTNFSLEVINVNDVPTGAVITLLEDNYTEGGPQWVSGAVQDDDIVHGDSLTYTWHAEGTLLIGTGQNINLSLPAGQYNITLEATDTEGASCTATVPVIVDMPAVIPDPDINVTDDDDDDDDIINVTDDDDDIINVTDDDDDVVPPPINVTDDDDVEPPINVTDDDDNGKADKNYHIIMGIVASIILAGVTVLASGIAAIRKKRKEPETSSEEVLEPEIVSATVEKKSAPKKAMPIVHTRPVEKPAETVDDDPYKFWKEMDQDVKADGIPALPPVQDEE